MREREEKPPIHRLMNGRLFCWGECRGYGARILRIATASLRSGFAMTGIFTWNAVLIGGGVWSLRPTGGRKICASPVEPSGTPAPTNRLPVELRRGRCPHRPRGTSPQNIRRAACPHAAARHTRRVPLSDQPAQALSASRMAAQRPCESKGLILHIPVREVRGNRRGRHLSRGKDFKTLVLAAFFLPFLSPQKERAPWST